MWFLYEGANVWRTIWTVVGFISWHQICIFRLANFFFLIMTMMFNTIIGRTGSGSEPAQRKLNNAIPIRWPNKTENRKNANRLNIHCAVQLIRCPEVRFHCENVFSERHFPPIGLAGYMYGTHIYTNNRFQYSMEHTYACVHSFAANISTSSSRYKNKRF